MTVVTCMAVESYDTKKYETGSHVSACHSFTAPFFTQLTIFGFTKKNFHQAKRLTGVLLLWLFIGPYQRKLKKIHVFTE